MQVRQVRQWLRRCGRIQQLRVHPPPDRGFRALLLLAALAIFNAFDLALTASQLPRGNFLEANVIAAQFVHDPHAMIAFKVVLFTLGATLLYRFRRTPLSEVAGWGLVACYGLLMVWWDAYLDAVEICLADHAIVTEIVPF